MPKDRVRLLVWAGLGEGRRLEGLGREGTGLRAWFTRVEKFPLEIPALESTAPEHQHLTPSLIFPEQGREKDFIFFGGGVTFYFSFLT